MTVRAARRSGEVLQISRITPSRFTDKRGQWFAISKAFALAVVEQSKYLIDDYIDSLQLGEAQ